MTGRNFVAVGSLELSAALLSAYGLDWISIETLAALVLAIAWFALGFAVADLMPDWMRR